MQDIDAAYIFDDDIDLDADLSALLEVPDLEAFQPGNPVVVNGQNQAPVPGAYLGSQTDHPCLMVFSACD